MILKLRKGTKIIVTNSSYPTGQVSNGQTGVVISKPKDTNLIFIKLDSGKTRDDGSNANYWCMYTNELQRRIK